MSMLQHAHVLLVQWQNVPLLLLTQSRLRCSVVVVQVAPAMNTFMWESTFTQQHLDVLLSFQIINIPPVVKRLACGEDGMGAMASPDDIAHAVENALQGFEFRTLDQR